jgi:hypothetical protein
MENKEATMSKLITIVTFHIKFLNLFACRKVSKRYCAQGGTSENTDEMADALIVL